jgi:putative glutathione S-transferase
MPETVSPSSTAVTSSTCATGSCASTARTPAPVAAGSRSALASPRGHRIRSRIGVGLAGGFYPAPHRYQLYLSEGCPRSLRISITLDLLGLHDSVATTLVALPAETPDAFAALRGAYEATWHHYDGPLTAPALCDRWSGRIVSNHTPDILRDLAGLPTGHEGARLHPPALAPDIDALRDLLDRNVTPTARPAALATTLKLLDRQLASHTYALGEKLTAADVDLWVALTLLDSDTALLRFDHLQEYVRRLAAHPAFHGRAGAGHPAR